MELVLKEFCNSSLNNRKLLLLTAPTGSRKTTAVRKYIVENYQKYCAEGKKIFFITQLKKNLPYEELEEDFKKAGMHENFLKDVMFVDNNADTVINSFLKQNIEVPQKEFTTLKIFKHLNNYKYKLNELDKNYSEDKADNLNNLKERIVEEFEPELRRKILAHLSIKCKTESERRNLIINGELSWVSKLYPTVFTSMKKVLMMSIDKFLSKHTTFIENAYFFNEHKSTEGAIIFIDEFDAAKNVIQKNQINLGMQGKVNLIQLFTKIYKSLTTMNFTQEILQDGKEFQYSDEQFTPLEIRDGMKKFADEIFNEFHLHNFYKLQNDRDDKRIESENSENNFLFYDVNFHSILSKADSNIHIDFKENINNFVLEKKLDDKYLLFNLIDRLNTFIDYFVRGIHWWTIRYQSIKNKHRKENDFSMDYARRSILSEFGLDSNEKEWITRKIHSIFKSANNNFSESSCYYDDGISFYHFIDSDNHASITNINYYNFEITPEKYLLNLLDNARIIGISATADVKTVLGNFNIDYLKSSLDARYYKLSSEDMNRMTDKFVAQKNESNKYEILVKHIESVNEEIDLSQYIKQKLNNEFNSGDYIIDRYIRTYNVIELFVKNDCKAFICFMNLHMNNEEKFNEKLIRTFWNDILIKYNKNIDEYGLYNLKTYNYNVEKKKVHDDLANNKKVLLFSTYQTIGAGQNIQYTIDNNIENDAYISEEDIIEEFTNKKDFDGIYIDCPTNVIVNMNDYVTEENFIKYLLQMEDLKENIEISDDMALHNIKSAFKKHYDNKHIKFGSLENTSSYGRFIYKTFVQATGRICRTNNKNNKVYILLHDKVCRELAKFEDEIKDFQNNEINSAIRYCLDNFANKKENVEINEDIIKNEENNKYLKYLMENFRKDENIRKEWIELRDFVLKYPLVHSEEALCKTKYKIQLHKFFDKPTNYYYFDYLNKSQHNLRKISKHKDKLNREFSYTKARIDKILKIPGIIEFFKDNGYKFYFDQSSFLLMPEIFDRIYLGALGELVGKYILKENKIFTYEIPELELFEIFDGKLSDDIFVDFKFHNETSGINRRKLNEIRKKKKKCNAKIVIIINILGTGKYEMNSIEKEGIFFIPALFNTEDNRYAKENIEKIKSLIIEFEKKYKFV